MHISYLYFMNILIFLISSFDSVVSYKENSRKKLIYIGEIRVVIATWERNNFRRSSHVCLCRYHTCRISTVARLIMAMARMRCNLTAETFTAVKYYNNDRDSPEADKRGENIGKF